MQIPLRDNNARIVRNHTQKQKKKGSTRAKTAKKLKSKLMSRSLL